LVLPFAAVAENPPAPTSLGANVVANASFEEPAQPDGTPPGRYYLGYPKPDERPASAFMVTEETAHSGRFSLKWDLSKVADPKATGRDPRWLVVNVGFDPETIKSLRGKRVKVGYWIKLGGGQTIPGLGLRQTLKEKPGDGFYYRGGVADPAAWNHFETEGRLSPDLQSMDIHTWCTVPEAEVAMKSFFFIDDISLEVIEEPPLKISTPLDEYYSGEPIPWTVTSTISTGQIRIALLAGERLVTEVTRQPGSAFRGELLSGGLKPGTYTLQATVAPPQQPHITGRRQLIIAPDPFAWGDSE
jgi:hypothetical protein